MSKNANNLKMLCLAGVMAALYVGLDFLAVSISAPFGGQLKISFSGLPVIIVSIFGGPLWGAATGFVGALVGQMITYGFSATTLLWVLPAVIRGLSMGLLFRAFKKSMKPSVLILETGISSLLVTLFNTGAMLIEQMLYGYYSSYYAIVVAIPTRVIAGIVTAVVFSLMLPTIVNSLKGILKTRYSRSVYELPRKTYCAAAHCGVYMGHGVCCAKYWCRNTRTVCV